MLLKSKSKEVDLCTCFFPLHLRVRLTHSLLRLLRNSHHEAGWLRRWFVTKTLLLLRVYRQITAQTGNQSHAIIELHRARRTSQQPGPLRSDIPVTHVQQSSPQQIHCKLS
jgi:hypothetical protein